MTRTVKTIANRIYNLDDFNNDFYEVNYKHPFASKDDQKRQLLIDWLESFTTGPYLMILKSVIFDNEQDATFFKLGYKDEDP